LKKAAKNKVKIKLILAGISDVTLSRRATHHIYATLLDNNIELYEWDKTVLHGKAAVVGQWTTIGSFNLNNLSSYGSLEMNVEIKSTAFASSYLEHLNEVMRNVNS
jgi:cardiolipin synthase